MSFRDPVEESPIEKFDEKFDEPTVKRKNLGEEKLDEGEEKF